MLSCLSSPPTAPPSNALAAAPEIARLIGLYFMAKNLGALPDPGGLLDQRADVYAYFVIFGGAEAEHIYNLNPG
jgi:hypothetical protein